jgi:hypothetical protein
MPRPWSEQRKKRLSSMQAAGRRPDEIAAALGLRREQVVARLKLIASWERNRATFAKALQKRVQTRLARGRKAIVGMTRAIAIGVPRNQAIAKAYDAGATWREIGAHFGITAEAASAAARRCGRGRRSAKTRKARRPARDRARKRGRRSSPRSGVSEAKFKARAQKTRRGVGEGFLS